MNIVGKMLLLSLVFGLIHAAPQLNIEIREGLEKLLETPGETLAPSQVYGVPAENSSNVKKNLQHLGSVNAAVPVKANVHDGNSEEVMDKKEDDQGHTSQATELFLPELSSSDQSSPDLSSSELSSSELFSTDLSSSELSSSKLSSPEPSSPELSSSDQSLSELSSSELSSLKITASKLSSPEPFPSELSLSELFSSDLSSSELSSSELFSSDLSSSELSSSKLSSPEPSSPELSSSDQSLSELSSSELSSSELSSSELSSSELSSLKITASKLSSPEPSPSELSLSDQFLSELASSELSSSELSSSKLSSPEQSSYSHATSDQTTNTEKFAVQSPGDLIFINLNKDLDETNAISDTSDDGFQQAVEDESSAVAKDKLLNRQQVSNQLGDENLKPEAATETKSINSLEINESSSQSDEVFTAICESAEKVAHNPSGVNDISFETESSLEETGNLLTDINKASEKQNVHHLNVDDNQNKKLDVATNNLEIPDEVSVVQDTASKEGDLTSEIYEASVNTRQPSIVDVPQKETLDLSFDELHKLSDIHKIFGDTDSQKLNSIELLAISCDQPSNFCDTETYNKQSNVLESNEEPADIPETVSSTDSSEQSVESLKESDAFVEADKDGQSSVLAFNTFDIPHEELAVSAPEVELPRLYEAPDGSNNVPIQVRPDKDSIDKTSEADESTDGSAPGSSALAPAPDNPLKSAMMGMPYDFDWNVRDDPSDSHYSHKASSDGVVTRGEYSVLLPDGRMQIVAYRADGNGYNVQIRYV